MSGGKTPFVVTGCGRSGTAYAAEVLSRLGLRLGHEVVFGPRTEHFTGFRDAQGDSSWLAAPFLSELPNGTVVVHQVRHPLAVVRSFVGIGFFNDRAALSLAGGVVYTHAKWQVRRLLMSLEAVPVSTKGPRPHRYFLQFVQRHAPDVYNEPTPAERALRYWVVWNGLVSGADRQPGTSYQFQRVEDLGVAAVRSLVATLGVAASETEVARVLAAVPRNTNGRAPVALAWSEIPDGPAKRDATELAATYGYDPANPDAYVGAAAPSPGR